MSLAPGVRLGPYEIVAPLGAGGMGEVYRARDTKLQREVALKIVPEAFASDPERLARFTREAHTLAALNHPHIAAIYGLDDNGAQPALVMELVDGEDLADRLARGPIPVIESLAIAVQIADALDAAHERGILHRDLKPANIKLRPDGTVKLLDFGLAKVLGPAAPGAASDDGRAGSTPATSPTITSPVAMTSAGMLLGTAAYMSPEQARGQPVDARTDVWAFGCVLFEMLTGTRAFAGDTITDVLAAVLKEEPRWTDLPPDTPGAIPKLLRRCLAKDRKHRLAAAADARLEIEEALDPRRTDPASTARTPRRHSPLRLAIGIATALTAIVGAYFLGSRAAIAPSTPTAVTRFVIPAPPATQIVSSHRELAISADGQQVAFIARGAADQHIYVRRLDDLAPRQVAGTEGARDLTFSPDGRWLAFHAGNKIRKVSLAGGVPAVLADAVHSHGLAWHPSEDAIYFAPNQLSAIWKVAASDGSPAVAVTTLDAAGGERSHEWPVFSADGGTLLFTVNSNTAELDEAAVSFLTLAPQARHTVRTGGSAFGFIDDRELLFVRRRAAMGASYRDGRLASPELLEAAAAITGPPNGGVVALSSSGALAYVPSPDIKQRSLVWIAPDGTESDAGFGHRDFGAVSLGQGGRRAAISIGDGPDATLYLADASGGPLTPLARPAAWTTAWSPDGKWIAGSVRLPNASTDSLARVSADAGGTWETLLHSEISPGIAAQWTPDGRGLLFSFLEPLTGRRSTALLAMDDAPPKVSVVVDSAGERIEQFPALSPDGRWLAYVSNQSGRAEVYAQNYPSPTVRVPVSQDGGTRPMWSSNGDAIYFVVGTAMVRRTVTTQTELRFGAPRVIVNDPLLVLQVGSTAKPFDVAPDGRILAIKEDNSIRSDHIVVVQNWLNDARARHSEARK